MCICIRICIHIYKNVRIYIHTSYVFIIMYMHSHACEYIYPGTCEKYDDSVSSLFPPQSAAGFR